MDDYNNPMSCDYGDDSNFNRRQTSTNNSNMIHNSNFDPRVRNYQSERNFSDVYGRSSSSIAMDPGSIGATSSIYQTTHSSNDFNMPRYPYPQQNFPPMAPVGHSPLQRDLSYYPVSQQIRDFSSNNNYAGRVNSSGYPNIPNERVYEDRRLPMPYTAVRYPGQGPAAQHNPFHSQSQMGMFPSGLGGGSPYNNHNQMMNPTHGSQGGSLYPAVLQGRAINKMLLDIVRDRTIDPHRLQATIDSCIDHMDCVNLATLLFHTGKKRFVLAPVHIKMISDRFSALSEELRSREASNCLYGLKCLSSEVPEVRHLIDNLAQKINQSTTDFVPQAVGNALYGCQMMTSDHEEVRYLLQVLSLKIKKCSELLEAQNVGNALYGLRGMNSDYKEVRAVIAALTPKVARAREELNSQALGNSLYGMQNMNSKEVEVRSLLNVMASKVTRSWEDLKAQEIGNSLYGLKRMSTEAPEVRMLLRALTAKIAGSPDCLDAQAIGNSLYGLQNMKSDNPEILSLLGVLADKIAVSNPELDGQAMGNSLYGLQGMSSDFAEVCAVVTGLTIKMQNSGYEMNAQELGNACYGLMNMTSSPVEVRRLLLALASKVRSSTHELTSQEIGNSLFGLQGMHSKHIEVRVLLSNLAVKITQSHSVLDPQGIANTLFGLQNFSSESAEVRSLVKALVYKVDHCWKVLNSYHIAHSCFGLQSLCSDHVEVRSLLKALVSKIIACREEMSAKHLSLAFFGMQRLKSDHIEVRAVLTSLAEKATLSGDLWTPQHFALALFGLQGISSEEEETTVILNIICHKLSMSMASQEFEPFLLGNVFFGLQSMKSTNSELIALLRMLLVPLKSTAMVMDRRAASICANIMFGIQGCSVAEDVIQEILEFLFVCIQQSCDYLQSISSSAPTEAFQEASGLFQACALALYAMPNMSAFPDIFDAWQHQLDAMEVLVMGLSDAYVPRALTVAEYNLANEVYELLGAHRGLVKGPQLLYGFELGLVVHSISGKHLFLEVVGSSYCHPVKERFCGLRAQYLERVRGVRVKRVPAERFYLHGGKALRDFPDILEAVEAIAQEYGQSPPRELDGRFFVCPSLQAQLGGLEYVDDEISLGEFDPYSNSSHRSHLQQHQQHQQHQHHLLLSSKQSFELGLGWIGDWPSLANVHQSHFASHSLHKHQLSLSPGHASYSLSSSSSIEKSLANASSALATVSFDKTLVDPYSLAPSSQSASRGNPNSAGSVALGRSHGGHGLSSHGIMPESLHTDHGLHRGLFKTPSTDSSFFEGNQQPLLRIGSDDLDNVSIGVGVREGVREGASGPFGANANRRAQQNFSANFYSDSMATSWQADPLLQSSLALPANISGRRSVVDHGIGAAGGGAFGASMSLGSTLRVPSIDSGLNTTHYSDNSDPPLHNSSFDSWHKESSPSIDLQVSQSLLQKLESTRLGD